MRWLYQTYLRSQEWDILRRQVIARDRFCRACGNRWRLQVHHIWYPEELGTESLSSLTTFCAGCHDLFTHRKRYRLAWQICVVEGFLVLVVLGAYLATR